VVSSAPEGAVAPEAVCWEVVEVVAAVAQMGAEMAAILEVVAMGV